MDPGSPDALAARALPALIGDRRARARQLARYAWAARLVSGKRVLDAGCGLAEGSELLRQAGASEVVGVDRGRAVLEAAVPDRVGLALRQADLRALAEPDGAFEVIVCFDVLQTAEETSVIIAELARVLAADGVLVASAPAAPGSVDLPAAMRAVFAELVIVRQCDRIASTIGESRGAGADAIGSQACIDLGAPAPEGASDSESDVLLVLAAFVAPPSVPALTALADATAADRWQASTAELERVIAEQRHALADTEAAIQERVELRRELIEAETALAEVPRLWSLVGELEVRIAELDAVRDQLRSDLHEQHVLDEQRREADLAAVREELTRAAVHLRTIQASLSWRLTRPLRGAKRLLTAAGRRGG